MAIAADPAPPDPFRQMANLWWLWLVTGIAWVVVALVVLQFDEASVKTVGVVTGIMFLVAGTQNLVLGMLADGATRWVLWFFAALLVIAGLISLVQPEDTFAAVADILGFIFLTIGVFWLIGAFSERHVNDLWWFGLMSGLAMIILAFCTSGQFFIERAYVLLVFAGIWALFHGVGDIIRAFQVRRHRDLTQQ
jgi:uncharacterized membrane protein HdeD (DUF308 family)